MLLKIPKWVNIVLSVILVAGLAGIAFMAKNDHDVKSPPKFFEETIPVVKVKSKLESIKTVPISEEQLKKFIIDTVEM